METARENEQGATMSNLAISLSESIAATVEAAGKSVVRVEAGGGCCGGGAATGVAFADGVVVTAAHAVEDADEVEVGLPDGKTATAKVAGRDEAVDLAVLRLEAPGLAPAAWAEADGLKVGHLALAVARPGRSVRTALGVVSVYGEEWRTPGGGRIERYLETDLDLPPGFSGSLLVDLGGRAVGLLTAGLVRDRAVALPAVTVRRVAAALLAKGRVERGFLGIGTQRVRLPAALAQTTGQETALLVVGLEPGGPAEKAGILLGDILVSLHGSPVRTIGDLYGLLDEERVGVASTARIVRAGEVRDVPITVGARP
jgi:S1-C subfamily serine protease